MMQKTTAPVEVTTRELRQFGLIMAGMISLVFGLLLPWIWDKAYPVWPFAVGGIFAAIALVFPAGLRPVYRVWMKIGHALGWVNTRIILGFVFFAVFLPFGFVMRLFGKDPMARHLDKKIKTYRVNSTPIPPDSLRNPY